MNAISATDTALSGVEEKRWMEAFSRLDNVELYLLLETCKMMHDEGITTEEATAWGEQQIAEYRATKASTPARVV